MISCPKCKSTDITPMLRGGYKCNNYSCGTTWISYDMGLKPTASQFPIFTTSDRAQPYPGLNVHGKPNYLTDTQLRLIYKNLVAEMDPTELEGPNASGVYASPETLAPLLQSAFENLIKHLIADPSGVLFGEREWGHLGHAFETALVQHFDK